MKKLTFVLAILLALVLPLSALAQENITSYTSGFQLQNLDATTAADVTISFINPDGSEDSSITDTIAANSSKTYYPLSGVSTGFNGSVVIASNTQVAAVANVLANGGDYTASYDGFTEGATTINIPLVMKNNFGISTWMSIQNTGGTAVQVTVDYSTAAVCQDTATIPVGAAATFDQATKDCLGTTFVGAAQITTDGEPVAATVMQVTSNTSGLKQSLLAYNGFTSASQSPFMPLVTSGYYGSGTGIQIQNTGATATDVTISYTPSSGFPGAACDETRNIPAGSSVTFGFPDLPAACYTDAGSAGSAAFVGAAQVTANSAGNDLVAVVNQVTIGQYNAAAYNAFNAAVTTNRVSLPLIMDNNYGIFTGFSVANLGAAATTITCTFTDSSYTVSGLVQPGEALTDVQLGKISDGYVGSAVCTGANAGDQIAAVLNQLNNGSIVPTYDGLLVSEGINY